MHRKEPNVSAEKGDFEESRRELEGKLREIKQMQPVVIEGEAHNSGTLSDNGGVVHLQPSAKIHRYQNKAPHTLTGRNSQSASVGASQQPKFTNDAVVNVMRHPYQDAPSNIHGRQQSIAASSSQGTYSNHPSSSAYNAVYDNEPSRHRSSDHRSPSQLIPSTLQSNSRQSRNHLNT